MSNTCVIEPTLFINQRGPNMTVGWRAHDDEAQTYDNTWHEGIPSDDMEFFKRVLTSNNAVLWSMLEACCQAKRGVFIHENYYPWDEIKALVQSEET